jgi:hypothetical protein
LKKTTDSSKHGIFSAFLFIGGCYLGMLYFLFVSYFFLYLFI